MEKPRAKPAGKPLLAMDLKDVLRVAEERLGQLELTWITGHLLNVVELPNLSLFAELDGVFCLSKGTDHVGHTLSLEHRSRGCAT